MSESNETVAGASDDVAGPAGTEPFVPLVLLSATVIFAVMFGWYIVTQQWALGEESSGTGGQAHQDREIGDYLGAAVLFAVLPLLAASTPWRRKFGVAWPAPNILTRTVRATVLVFLAQTVVGVAAKSVAPDDQVSRSLDDVFGGQSPVTRLAMAAGCAASAAVGLGRRTHGAMTRPTEVWRSIRINLNDVDVSG